MVTERKSDNNQVSIVIKKFQKLRPEIDRFLSTGKVH